MSFRDKAHRCNNHFLSAAYQMDYFDTRLPSWHLQSRLQEISSNNEEQKNLSGFRILVASKQQIVPTFWLTSDVQNNVVTTTIQQ
jgi:hypothetical protein